jgi:hypothetical protein
VDPRPDDPLSVGVLAALAVLVVGLMTGSLPLLVVVLVGLGAASALGLWSDDGDDVAREVYEEVSGEPFDRDDADRDGRWRLGTDLGWRRSVGRWGEADDDDEGGGSDADADADADDADAADGSDDGDGPGDDDGWPWGGSFWREGSVDDHWRERTGFDPEAGASGGRAGRADGRDGGWSRGGSAVGDVDGPGESDATLAEARRVLGVEADADEAAVRRAYRERVKEVHPDTPGGSASAFMRVREAYERLRAHRGGRGERESGEEAAGGRREDPAANGGGDDGNGERGEGEGEEE